MPSSMATEGTLPVSILKRGFYFNASGLYRNRLNRTIDVNEQMQVQQLSYKQKQESVAKGKRTWLLILAHHHSSGFDF